MPVRKFSQRVTQLPRIAGLGDSRIENGRQLDASNIKALTRGFINRAQAKMGGRFVHNPLRWDESGIGDCFGVTGYTTTQIISNGLHTQLVTRHQANNYASPYAAAVVLCSTNDRTTTNSLSYATTIANLLTIRDTLWNAGIPIIWLDETPRNDAGITGWTTQKLIHYRVSDWLRSRHGLPGERTVCVHQALSDMSVTTGADFAAYFLDDLHPNQLGASIIADKLALALAEFCPPAFDLLPPNGADQFNATDNPTGFINSDPFMTGAFGAAAGTGVTGNVAPGMTSAYAGSGTAAFALSKYTHTDNTIWQKVVASGTPAASNTSLSITGANLSASVGLGDVWDVMCEVMYDPNQVGLNRIALNCFTGAGVVQAGATNIAANDRSSATEVWEQKSVQTRELIRLPRFTSLAAGSLTPSIQISPLQVALNFTVYFRCLTVRKNRLGKL